MAQLSDLPAEIILQICSFVRPGLNGKKLLDDQEPGQILEEDTQDWRNLNSLKSFCRTSKKYNGLRNSILFTSIVECHNLKESAVESVATLLRVLLANPGGRTHVRSLHMFLYVGEDMDEDVMEIPWPLSPPQVRTLENVAAAVGINTTKKIRDLKTGCLITLRGVAKNTQYLRSDRLFGYEMLLLLLLVPGVQDLTLVINSGTLDWMLEAAAVIDALKKHARTLRTLCFQRHEWTDDKQDEYAIADLGEFVAMEKLWITATLLRSVGESGHKVDNVLLKLHLHNYVQHLVEDLRNISEGAKRGDYSINFTLSLDDNSKRGKKVFSMFRERNFQVVVGETRPVLW
ncbi:hypothetical protein K4K57_000480 [Colletotrichum sp. SAR 10_99]|nr:hypothetical protein K4K57_000480 [Colletotrichum sp. SAR 10_99]